MERSDEHQPADAPPADVDDVSASTASAALETSVAFSSTIASSSLSTFSQTATVERGVEQAAEEVERGGDGGHHGDGLLPPAPPSVAPSTYSPPFLASATEAAGGEETSTPPVPTADVPVSAPAAAVPPRPSFSVSPAVDVDGEKTAEKNTGNAHDPIEEGVEQGTAEERREADNASSQPPSAAAPTPSPLRASGAETDESHNDNDGSTRRSLDLSGDAGGAGGDVASAASQLHVAEPELNDGGDLGVQHSMSVRSITSGTRASTDAAHSLRRPRHGSHASSMEEEVEASAPLATQHRSRISATADSTAEQLSSVEQDDRTDAQGGGDGDDEASRADAPPPPPQPELEGGEEEDVGVEVSTTATRTQREGDVRSGTASSSVPTDAPRRRRRGSGSNPQRRRPHSGPRPPATAALSGGVMDRPAESSPLTQQASASSSQHRHRLQLDAVRPQLITVDAPVTTLTLDVASTRSSLPSTPLVIADQQSDHAGGKRKEERRRAASTTTAAPAVPNMSSPAPAAARQSRQENSWSTPLFPSSEEEEEEKGELNEENIESRFPQPQQQQQQQPPAPNAEEEEAAAVVGTTFVVPVHTPARVASLSSTENVLPTEAQHPSQPRQQQRPSSSSTTSAPQPLPLLPLSATEMTSPTPPQSTPSPSPAAAAAAATINTTAPVAAPVAASVAPPTAVVSTPSSPLPRTPRVVAASLSSVESGEQPQRVASPLSETNVADGASSCASPLPLPPSAPHPPAAPTAPPQAAILTSSEASSGAAAAATTPPSLPAALPVTNTAEKMVSQQLYPRLRASTISPPQLAIDESIETSSITAAASLTLESARHTGPRLSLSAIPINSLGGQSPLAMAQFANRGTVSADESSHHRHNGTGDSRRRNGSRSSSSYSYYSYSYTGSYTSDEEDAADTPRQTSAPRVQLPAVGVAQGSTSMSSTAHHRELSVTRVGPADGPASTRYGVVVGLTAYEEITAAAAKDSAKPGGALRFLRCLAKKPAERTRTWRTEEHVAHTAVSALMPAQPPHSANAEGSASGEGEDVQTVAAAGTSRRRGTHTANSASNADPLSATASAAGEVDEESTPEVGSMTEAAHDRDSRRVATEEAGNDTEDAIAVTQTEGDEGDLQDVADSPSREGAEQTAAVEEVKDGELAASAESSSRGAEASAGAGAEAAGIDAASHTIELLSPASADDHADAALLSPTAAETETSASAMAPQPPPQPPAAAEGEAPPQSEDGVPGSKGCEAVQPPAPAPTSPTDSEDGAADLQRGGAALTDGATSVKERDTSNSASVVVSVNDNASAEGEVGAAAAVADQADEASFPQDLSAKAAKPEDAEAPNDEAAGEVKEEETLKEEELPLGPLQAFYVYEEHLPRFTSWDAETPTAADAEDDEEEGSGAKRKKKESLQHRLAAEAAAASEAAAAALQSALHDMAVHPPRQCLFVEVRGLLQLSATLLWPRSTQASPTDPSNTVSGFTAPRAPLDVWRGGGEALRATADTAVSLNGVATVEEAAEETPEWTELRLALYSNDRQHCIAAGSTFTVPANAAAVRRSCGHAMKAAVGAGRDSWSDVLVYQVDEGTGATESEFSAAGALPEVGNGANTPRTAVSSASARSSAFNAAAVYLQLEEKRERWVPVVVEEPHGAPGVPRSAAAVPLAAAESDADESVEWRTDSERSGAASAPPSEDPPTGRHISRLVPGLHSNAEINSGSTTDQAVAVLEEEEVQPPPQQLPLRLEEHWDFLAVSPPLPMSQLKNGLAGGISPFYLTMATPPSLQTPLMLQQQESVSVTTTLQSVSCRVQWAVEPPPPVPLPVTTSDEQQQQQQQQQQDCCAAPTWASLGEAIAQYEITCRGGEVAYGGDRSAASPDREVTAASSPVTVLWETICTPAAALQCQTAESARGASLTQSHRLGHGWRGGAAHDASPAAALPLPPHTAARPHRPAVCSVVMRCATALVVDVMSSSTAAVQREARGLTSTYCVPTVLAVTGGMDGLVAQTAAAVDRTALQSRTPVMHYNLAFHALLTREDAPTLLLTVRSAAMPSLVFGFAEWNPFERAEQVAGVESVTGGLMDVWLPLYASSEAAVTAADAQERRRRPPHLPSSPSTSSTFSPVGPSQRGGMVRVGWLHCDVEVVFLSSLTEAAVRQLWAGTRGSLMALQRAAEQLTCNGEQESYHHDDDDVVMDFSVVEAVGLQPLETRFGAPLPPVPFAAQPSREEAEGDASYCTRVYCELVAVQNASVQPDVQDGGKRNTLIDNGGGVAATSLDRRSSWGVGGGSGGTYGLDASAYSRGSAGGWGEARRGQWSPSASMRGPDSNGGVGLHADPPVTAAVVQTNHPRWQHTFRCGLAALSSLRLRVFDRPAPDRSRSDEKDRRGAVKLVSSSRSVLLGTAVVSPQMLRRIAATSGEGSAWLPLLWSAGASNAVAPVSRSRGISPALSNGYVLLQWRRANSAPSLRPPRLPLLATTTALDEIRSGASVTYRCRPATTSAAAATRRREAREGPFAARAPVAPHGSAGLSPSWRWPQGPSSFPGHHTLTWMHPALEPWLWVHGLRLQWPWLQHLLCLYGGHLRLGLSTPFSDGAAQTMGQLLLVPLAQLMRTTATDRRRQSRISRLRSAAISDTSGGSGVFGVVSSASLCLDAFHRATSSSTRPLESTFCMPASPAVSFAVWWFPNSVPFPTMETAVASACCSPRVVGRGTWAFPPLPESEEDGTSDTLSEASSSEDAQGGGEDASLRCALHRFFTPHESAVRLSAVHGANVPPNVAPGVLRWQLSSVPRLIAASWGTAVHLQQHERPLRNAPPSAGARAGGEGKGTRWRWPEVGTAATLQLCVQHLLWLHHADDAAVVAMAGNMCVAVAAEAPAPAPTTAASTQDAPCCAARDGLPSGDVPRVPYVLSSGGGSGAAWSEARSSRPVSVYSSSHAPSVSLSARDGQPCLTGVDGREGEVRGRAAAVELRWSPRRYEWFDDDAPTATLWIVSPLDGSERRNAEGAGAAADAAERVWGAVRLPRLEALTTTSGVMWLPLFRTYTATGVSEPGSEEAPSSPPQQQERQADDGAARNAEGGEKSLQAASDAVEHVGFAAVAFSHNFVAAAAPEALLHSDEPVRHVGSSPPSVRTGVTRLFLVEVGPLRCRCTDAVVRAATPPPSLRAASAGAVGSGAAQASASYSLDNFTASSGSTPVAGPALELTPADRCVTGDAAQVDEGAEVLLGFADRQLSVPVRAESTSSAAAAVSASSQQSWSCDNMAVFPWPPAAFPQQREREVGAVRVQTRLLNMKKEKKVAAGSTFCVTSTDPSGGAQWVPLFACGSGVCAAAGDATFPEDAESVLGEVLVRWRVLAVVQPTTREEAPATTTTSASEAAAAAAVVAEALRERRLVETVCGGSGSPCTYAILDSPAATLHTSLASGAVGGTAGAAAAAADGAGAVVSRVRAWAASLQGDTGVSQTPSPAPSSALHTLLCRGCSGPVARPWVYLLVDPTQLLCSAAHCRAWPQLTHKDPDSATDTFRFRLEVRMEWPASWRRASASAAGDGITSLEGTASVPHTIAESSPLSQAAGALVWGDAADVIISFPSVHQATASAEHTADAAVECAVEVASASPLSLPLPSAEHIRAACGPAGLAARFNLFLRLVALPPEPSADTQNTATAAVIVGVGSTPLSYPSSMQLCMTTLTPPSASADHAKAVTTSPLLLSWSAQVVNALPLPQEAVSLALAPPTSPDAASVAVKGSRGDAYAPAALDRCGPFTTSITSNTLMRLTVHRMEVSGVDVSLASGAAQRHRQALPPATVAVMVGGGASEEGTAGATTVLLSPSLTTAATNRRAAAASAVSRTTQQHAQRRYSWTAEVCAAAESTLVFYVRVPEASLRATRGEEIWATPDDDDRRDVVGKAVYTFDAAPARHSHTGGTPALQEIVLDLESPTVARWIGRLWLKVERVSTDALLRTAPDVFLSTSVSAAVHHCTGLVAGDLPLLRSVEETYDTLRERVRQEHERRGSIPRRLRLHMREVRRLRRQVGKQSENTGEVRLVCAARDGVDETAEWTSRPFQLPSALALVRGKLSRREQSSPHLSTEEDFAASPRSLLRVTRVVQGAASSEAAAADSAMAFELRLVAAAGAADDHDVLAVGQVRLPLRAPSQLSQSGSQAAPSSWVQRLTVPLTHSLRNVSQNDKGEKGEVAAPPPLPVVVTSAPNTHLALDVTATWSTTPQRGDTFLTCLFLSSVGSGAASAATCGGHRHWRLRWVYCFEASARPAEEHAVEMPLSLRPSAQPNTRHRRAAAPAGRLAVSSQQAMPDRELFYWSGATTRLPCVGAVGAALRRVELVEATPASSHASADPQQEGGDSREEATTSTTWLTTRLAVHTWTVDDELRLRLKRRAAQETGSDAHVWLDLRSDATAAAGAGGGRRGLHFQVLLSLYTSSAVARQATQLLEKHAERQWESVTVTERTEREKRFPAHPGLFPRSQERLNAAVASKASRTAAATTAAAPLSATTRGISDDAEKLGGVVIKSLVFTGSGATLAAAGLKRIDSVTCRVLRQPEIAAHTRGTAPSAKVSPSLVLEVGPAVRVLQIREASCEDATTAPAAVAVAPSPPPVPTLTDVRVAATWASLDCGVVSSSSTAAASSCWLRRQPQSLVRLDAPTGAAAPPHRAITGAVDDSNHDEDSTEASEDAAVYLEVVLRGGDTVARFTTSHFSASSILRSVACSEEEMLKEGQEESDVASLSWSSCFPLELSEQPAVAPGPAIAPCEVEVQWGLDVLGIHPVRAVVPCVCAPTPKTIHCTISAGGVAGEESDGIPDKDDDNDDDDDDGVRQLEGCAAWTEFLASLRTQDQQKDSEAHLRHWRCRVTAVEVEGLELPVWGSTTTAAVETTTLLAQLRFATTRGRDGQTEEKDGANHVLGVARTTARRIAAVRADATTQGVGYLGKEEEEEEEMAAGTLWSSLRRQAALSCRATFAPLDWCITAHDMMRGGSLSSHHTQDNDSTDSTSTAAGLTLWQLLCPTSAATDMREVCALGAVSLALLLREGALVLAQVLARWCSGACSTEARDTMLRAAAALPTQWMPLTTASSFLPDTLQMEERAKGESGFGWDRSRSGCGPRVRLYYTFFYDGPPCSTPRALPSSHSTAAVTAASAQQPRLPADAVYCAQLDHVQLRYSHSAGAVGDVTDRAAASWLSRAQLQLRVVRTVRGGAACGGDDASPVSRQTLTQWTTRLAPLPAAPPPPPSPARHSELSPASNLTHAIAAAPAPVPVPIPVPVPVPVVAATTKKASSPVPSGSVSAAESMSEAHNGDNAVATAAAAAVNVVLPAIPAASCFCWQPQSTDSHSSNETATLSVEVTVVVLDASAHAEKVSDEGDDVAVVVGQDRVVIADSQRYVQRWDSAENRLDTGWRLTEPLAVSIPVHATFPQTADGSGAVTNASVAFDLLAFVAPSWGQVAALQAVRQARDARHASSLEALQRAERQLLTAVAATKTATSVPTINTALTLHQLSTAFAARPYRLLKLPPAVYRLDSFAVVDVIPAVRDVMHAGQWVWSCGGVGGASHGRCLVDANSGAVCSPAWRLLPSLLDTTQRSGGLDGGRSEAHRQSEMQSTLFGLPAGRALLQEVARLRLDWRCSTDASFATSSWSRMPGNFGSVALFFVAANRSSCLWVSGGLRALRDGVAQDAAVAKVRAAQARQRKEGSVVSPTPPPRSMAAARRSSPRRRRSSAVDASVCVGGTEATPTAAVAALERPSWCCEVDASAAAPTGGATRIFHTATQLGERVWLLGGWQNRGDSQALWTTTTTTATGSPTTASACVSSGLVQRRRSEVRLAATPVTDLAGAAASPSALQWCDGVSCVQSLADGRPAPPVDIVAKTDSPDNAPRVACHVAVACGRRHVVVFGGLVPGGRIEQEAEKPSVQLASATADVLAYDTVQGTWMRLAAATAESGGGHWPLPRYGHSCAVLPGTGETSPHSYLVVGGATTLGSGLSCALVPPEELLWVWTPHLDADGGLYCTWRVVQTPADMPSPLQGRFLPQVVVLSAAEVVASMQLGGETAVDGAALDAGLTSLVLCVIGGMTEAREVPSAMSGRDGDDAGALRAFHQCVAPWLQSPAAAASAVLLSAMCERPPLEV